nr:hypothetical protein [Methanolobus psychrotolerans]
MPYYQAGCEVVGVDINGKKATKCSQM